MLLQTTDAQQAGQQTVAKQSIMLQAFVACLFGAAVLFAV